MPNSKSARSLTYVFFAKIWLCKILYNSENFSVQTFPQSVNVQDIFLRNELHGNFMGPIFILRQVNYFHTGLTLTLTLFFFTVGSPASLPCLRWVMMPTRLPISTIAARTTGSQVTVGGAEVAVRPVSIGAYGWARRIPSEPPK